MAEFCGGAVCMGFVTMVVVTATMALIRRGRHTVGSETVKTLPLDDER